jgi:hypothetical protein
LSCRHFKTTPGRRLALTAFAHGHPEDLGKERLDHSANLRVIGRGSRERATCSLAGIFSRSKGGFFHDGRSATLLDVVNHYNTVFSLGLTDAEKADLIEYLKSL